jgi:integrase
MGKTIKSGQKRKLGINRRLKYISVLKSFAGWIEKDFDKVSLEDMERVISALENDQIKARTGKVYSEETKVDFKRLLKKFYKWLLGNNETYPGCVSWFDTSIKEKEIPSLTREEVEKLAEHCGKFSNKVIIMVLFDSGARIEEFLNIRAKHITKKEDYYLLRIQYSKTQPRTIAVPLCTQLLDQWIKDINCIDSEAPLFPFTYDSVRMMLKRTGRKLLNKTVYPHLLRHSSATYYANIEKNYFRFCKRYGWTFGSRMAQRYIDRAGVDEEITAKAVQGDEISKVRTENIRLKEDMNRLQAQLGQLDKINLVLDEAFRNYPEFREIITNVARQKVRENKI